MKIKSSFLNSLHLDPSYCLLSVKNVALLLKYYKALDIREELALDDLQFEIFMQNVTDLSEDKITNVFDMLDVDHDGVIDFDEFYLLICIMTSFKDGMEKQFISCHSKTVFELLDQDNDNHISIEEFETFGFAFNFRSTAVQQIFHEYDVSDDQRLDYQEFRMFAMACVDRQKELVSRKTDCLKWREQLCTVS